MNKDYRSSTVYQIYIKSFCDSNGDGIGDINGIRSKLKYIQSLGVKYIWVTPFFCSPMIDNGYDVADYKNINPMFGTMSDCEALISEAGGLGMGLMFDMVFNHTSTQHEWFRKALTGDPEYMNYYIFRDGDADTPPAEWTCSFGGSAWEYVPELKKWYLHLFDPSQADLNWENPKVRNELKDVIRFWKAKGVKGFRFDVLNLISKPESLNNLPSGSAVKFCRDGHHVHDFIRELVIDTGIENMITVGEMASTTLDNCINYTNPERHELSMCFNFHHLKVDYKDGNKWALMPPDLNALRNLFREWQESMSLHDGWSAVFWCNHDQPRIVSRLGSEGKYWKHSAKMLATFIHMLRGTPYIFQGEELGMTNAHFTRIEDYKDVESINYYKILTGKGVTSEEALNIIAQRSRDNGRTPMQWTSGRNAGFTEADSAWIGIPDNYKSINVESEESDPDSILNYYRELVKLRSECRIISDGSVKFLDSGNERVFAFERSFEGKSIIVICSFSPNDERINKLPAGKVLLTNYDTSNESENLRPFEAIVVLK
ncbi:MAG: alpha,alpha-phosphotrehalase [Synergistaceae bacterium]|nr:alpha,alpha-phosphotrehalase [Synergistaceae bacterium]